MSKAKDQDLSAFSMMDLFRQEVEAQAAVLNAGLVDLERDPSDPKRLESSMRAAHSIKGAARIVGLDTAVQLAHAMEDCLVAAQQGTAALDSTRIDLLLQGVDLLQTIGRVPEGGMMVWDAEHGLAVQSVIASLAGQAPLPAVTLPAPATPAVNVAVPIPGTSVGLNLGPAPVSPALAPPVVASTRLPVGAPAAELKPLPSPSESPATTSAPAAKLAGAAPDRSGAATDMTVRVSAESMNRVMGLVGETLVQNRWFEPFADSLLNLKEQSVDLIALIGKAQIQLGEGTDLGDLARRLADMRQRAEAYRRAAHERWEEFDGFSRRSTELVERLYRETVAGRMRPFSDGVQGFPRMIRDLARRLNKNVRFEITGHTVKVDREILEKLEAPLTHLLRNSVDHGVELPVERQARDKAPEAQVHLEARHRAGLLHITVSDDGRGIDLETIRRKVVSRGLCTPDMVGRLNEAELLDFMFLPGFSTTDKVTEISGRGVGLDIVRNLAQEVGGLVQVENHPGQGVAFHLQMPVTLSILRVLLVEIAGEPFALPLNRIDRLRVIDPGSVQSLEGRRYVMVDGVSIGLVSAADVLELKAPTQACPVGPLVVVEQGGQRYGVRVDRFIAEQKLVVRPLDTRLGKVRDVNAVSLMDDGTPVIILDVEDLIRSVDTLLAGGGLRSIREAVQSAAAKKRKRVLVTDDSITVREMERKLLSNRGYEVDVAVDGMDGWNTVRAGQYDLVVSDVDMPRLNGIEFVKRIKQDPRLHDVPVIIVSYKDREEDRLKGLEAGANYYLTKSSFHDESFVNAVVDLIGDP